MSRKDYVAMAQIVARISNETTRRTVAEDMAIVFMGDNPRFDRNRFMEACNVS